MVSHGCEGGEGGIEELGQASPRDTPSICVRVEGHTVERLFMRRSQRVGMVMIGTEVACVDGCERR